MDNMGGGYRKLATAAAFLSLYSFAVILAITPASINEIGRDYHASPSLLGVLYLFQAAGFLLTVMMAGWLSDRRGKFPVMLAGSISMAAGALVFAHATSFIVLLVAVFLMGIGGGLSEAIAMAAVADLYAGDRRTAMLNWAQSVFAIGAISAPLAIAKLLSMGMDWRIGFTGAAVVCGMGAVALLAASVSKHPRPAAPHGPHADWRSLLRDPLVIWLSIGIMLYVGAEAGQGNWLAAYFARSLRAAPALAASTVAIFWAGISAGRITATWISRHMSDVSIICWALGLAAAAQAALLLVGSPISALTLVFVLGFSLAPVWPTILSRAGEAYPSQSGTVFGILVAMGAVGFAIVPPVVGRVGDAVGIHLALWICFAILVVDLAIFVRLRSGEKQEGSL